MDRIDKYKRVKEDQQQGKGKVKVIPQGRMDFRSDRFNVVRPRKDHVGPIGSTNTQVVNVVFREPVHRVLEKIKNEPFFKWPNKMNHFLTLQGKTRASIVNIIKNRGTLRKNVGICGTL